MQKRQGNGIQGKQAVRPHKSSWLETKPGADLGGHVAPRWPKHRVRQHSKQTHYCTAPGRCMQCDNYSRMNLKPLSKLQPLYSRLELVIVVVATSLSLKSSSCSHFHTVFYSFKQSDCSYCTNWSRMKQEYTSKQTPGWDDGGKVTLKLRL